MKLTPEERIVLRFLSGEQPIDEPVVEAADAMPAMMLATDGLKAKGFVAVDEVPHRCETCGQPLPEKPEAISVLTVDDEQRFEIKITEEGREALRDDGIT